MEDDRLRLIFTCCHPSLAPEAQTALTLREVCGLTTEDVARAFLIPAPTLAQRIVRAKARIRDQQIPYRVPPQEELPERLDGVLRVIYLVFNEGYTASAGDSLTRPDLSGEAIRLGRLLVAAAAGTRSNWSPRADAAAGLAPRGPHHAGGDLIPLEEQDRSLWDVRADNGRNRAGEAGAFAGPVRPLFHPGGDRRGTRSGAERSRDGLGPDRQPLRSAVTGGPFSRHRVEPRRGGGHAGWA